MAGYGTVYHIGSADEMLKLINETQSIMWMAHPRTKSSALFPDMYKDKDFFLSDRFDWRRRGSRCRWTRARSGCARCGALG